MINPDDSQRPPAASSSCSSESIIKSGSAHTMVEEAVGGLTKTAVDAGNMPPVELRV